MNKLTLRQKVAYNSLDLIFEEFTGGRQANL